jgi:hypothetical protein
MVNVNNYTDKRKQLERLYLDAVYYHLTNKGYKEDKAKVYAVRAAKILVNEVNA